MFAISLKVSVKGGLVEWVSRPFLFVLYLFSSLLSLSLVSTATKIEVVVLQKRCPPPPKKKEKRKRQNKAKEKREGKQRQQHSDRVVDSILELSEFGRSHEVLLSSLLQVGQCSPRLLLLLLLVSPLKNN